VAGFLKLLAASNSVSLLQLAPTLQWDPDFRTDHFGDLPTPDRPYISALSLQPDGMLLAGGYFFQVGGYWRRHIVRLTPDGHVDPCFDPGLGLGGFHSEGPVRRLALQDNGRVLIGGRFEGVDGVSRQHNLARFLPSSECNQVRVYCGEVDQGEMSKSLFAAATFPPGGTNILEHSQDLAAWSELERSTEPYIYIDAGAGNLPSTHFFRARQER
jgi:hypothetical protein